MKISPLGAELVHADGWTDRRTDRHTEKMKLIAAFRNAGNASKNREKTRIITFAKTLFLRPKAIGI